MTKFILLLCYKFVGNFLCNTDKMCFYAHQQSVIKEEDNERCLDKIVIVKKRKHMVKIPQNTANQLQFIGFTAQSTVMLAAGDR